MRGISVDLPAVIKVVLTMRQDAAKRFNVSQIAEPSPCVHSSLAPRYHAAFLRKRRASPCVKDTFPCWRGADANLQD